MLPRPSHRARGPSLVCSVGFGLIVFVGDTAMGAFKTVGSVAVVLAFVFARGWMRYELRAAKASPEQALLTKIEDASGEERQRLIAELDALPNKTTNFFDLWMTIHDAWQVKGWSDEGFDSSKVDLPRDVQLLAGVEFGIVEIDNGGLLQFFSNDTGGFAPEMMEWFDRAGLPEGADALRKAMAKFGDSYPRSQISRQKFLAKCERENAENPDPFADLDGELFEALEGKGGKTTSYEAVADRWLRETCRIQKLTDSPGSIKSK
jgi:hypothetical protein